MPQYLSDMEKKSAPHSASVWGFFFLNLIIDFYGC